MFGDHQDRRVAVAIEAADITAELDPVAFGHVDIQQHAIIRNGCVAQLFKGTSGRGLEGHMGMPGLRQTLPQNVKGYGVVVDCQNLHNATFVQLVFKERSALRDAVRPSSIDC